MTWDIAVAGTVTLDDVTTPHGRRTEQPGGSAVYSALAAAGFAPVFLIGTRGRDGDRCADAIARRGIRTDGLTVVDRPTFRWRAVHDYDRWITGSEASAEGAYVDWSPRLPEPAARAPVLFAGSMRPDLQSLVIDQSRARLIGIDSMSVFIAAGRHDVAAVVERADVLFLDRAELGALTATSPARWRHAAGSLCGRGRLRAVVVKGGPAGAACVTAESVTERPAGPVAAVIDPTGAGDALAGGFLGACAMSERDDEGQWPEALERGIECAAAAISGFGTEALLSLGAAAHPTWRRRGSRPEGQP
ncbi:MAG: PfkB family carbohydrate kinase [Candidatus Dormibacteria bacterium]